MVTIEPITLAHAPAIQALASDPEITSMTLLPEPYPPDGAAQWIRFVLRQADPPAQRPFLIRADGVPVGGCGFKDVSEIAGTGEYGYWIGRAFWGQGYATAAGLLALKVAFNEWGLATVCALPLARNAASCRVLEKLGFERTGLQPNPFPKWKPIDRIAHYEITRPHWRMHLGR